MAWSFIGHDVVIGNLLLSLSIIFILYYTFWTIGLPLLEPDFFAHRFFPSILYAIGIPLATLAVLVALLAIYAWWLMKYC